MRFRALEPSDIDLLYNAENDLEAMLQGDLYAPLSRRILELYIRDYDADPLRAGQLRLVICDEEPIGLLDFYEVSARDANAQVAILILPQFRGRGLGLRAARLAKDYARAIIGLKSLAVRIHTDNDASRRLFAKAGFDYIGTMRQWHFSDGRLRDVEIRQCLL